jgi:uncharacterized protein (TIGR01777 family)
MKVLIFGGTGLIGQALLAHPSGGALEWAVVTRNPSRRSAGGVPQLAYDEKELLTHFSGDYGLVNLAGASIALRPWTRSRQRVILNSRVSVSEKISSLVNQAPVKPRFIIQASAVGFYGSRGEEHLDERAGIGQGFLPRVTKAWEQALKPDAGIRTIFIRTGLVLTGAGGFLAPLLPQFRLFVGGHFGNGRQWMPWIHMEDELGAIFHLMHHPTASGVFNLAAPNPVRAREFARELGRALNRPSWLHIPAPLVRLLPNGFGEELLLTSQYVQPRRLLESGYDFRFTHLPDALNDLFGHA